MLRAIVRLSSMTMRLRVRPAGRSALAACLLLAISVPTVAAQTQDQVKAAFLFNFARYVQWPEAAFASEEAPVRICMAGAGGFAEVVSNTVSGKSVGNRAVNVETRAGLESVTDCHILYVGDDVTAGPAAVASSVEGAHVFTVAEREGFATGGGIANFVRADNKIRFEINAEAAKKAGLRISSRLLRLARVVKVEP